MTFTMELDAATHSTIHIKLFKNVENVPEIRKKIMSRELECCIIKPSLILHPFQIVVAANKAAVAGKTTTKSIYTEILYNLSISKNISQSLQKFGVDDGDKDLLVVVIRKNDSTGGFESVSCAILGEERTLEELNNLRDLDAIKKAYKISDEEIKDSSLLESVVSRIAVKDFVSV